jgi:hypothetical protein
LSHRELATSTTNCDSPPEGRGDAPASHRPEDPSLSARPEGSLD